MTHVIIGDILFLLWENKYNLISISVASGIGLIIGKRWGIRFAINYLMRVLGFNRKEINLQQLASQVFHHEEQIKKLGGEPWIAEPKRSRVSIIGQSFRSRWGIASLVQYATWFTRPKEIDQYKLRGKKKMSRKLIMMLFGTIVMTLSQFGITLDPETVIGVGTLIISAILGQSIVDTNGVGQYAPLKEKFKSKKLWTALGGSIFIVLNDYFSLGISSDIIYWIVGIGVTYILGKSTVSVVQAGKNAGGKNDKLTIPIEPSE